VLQVLGRAMGGEIQASNMENEVKLSILRWHERVHRNPKNPPHILLALMSEFQSLDRWKTKIRSQGIGEKKKKKWAVDVVQYRALASMSKDLGLIPRTTVNKNEDRYAPLTHTWL
jgi:hypothetical protein